LPSQAREKLKKTKNKALISYIKRMDLQISNMTNLVYELLDVNRIEAGKMILNKKPLSITEVKEYVKDVEGKEALVKYMKKFGKVSKEQHNKMKKAIISLNNPKIKEENIAKVIDFLPEDHEDVNKIFPEANLNEEEAKALVEIVKGN